MQQLDHSHFWSSKIYCVSASVKFVLSVECCVMRERTMSVRHKWRNLATEARAPTSIWTSSSQYKDLRDHRLEPNLCFKMWKNPQDPFVKPQNLLLLHFSLVKRHKQNSSSISNCHHFPAFRRVERLRALCERSQACASITQWCLGSSKTRSPWRRPWGISKGSAFPTIRIRIRVDSCVYFYITEIQTQNKTWVWWWVADYIYYFMTLWHLLMQNSQSACCSQRFFSVLFTFSTFKYSSVPHIVSNSSIEYRPFLRYTLHTRFLVSFSNSSALFWFFFCFCVVELWPLLGNFMHWQSSIQQLYYYIVFSTKSPMEEEYFYFLIISTPEIPNQPPNHDSYPNLNLILASGLKLSLNPQTVVWCYRDQQNLPHFTEVSQFCW